MRLEHTCTITRPGADTRSTDPESGQKIGAAPADEVVYEGRCRYTNDGAAVMRAKGGDVSIEGSGLVQLPRQAAIVDAETDSVSVTANGVTFDAKIAKPMYNGEQVNLLLKNITRPVEA